mmetsp:Transcript_50258/g.132562  ORF Transcript_50258/g.132562 Transcript_50258/m.132562 type:complete len:95 (+) Transcript_50258:2795-3079(+)|eukprot:5527267-Prymnesium_polylepis.1
MNGSYLSPGSVVAIVRCPALGLASLTPPASFPLDSMQHTFAHHTRSLTRVQVLGVIAALFALAFLVFMVRRRQPPPPPPPGMMKEMAPPGGGYA